MPDFRLEEINLLEQEIGPFLFEINERLRIYNDLVRDVETTGLNVYVGDNGFAEVSPGTSIATYISVISKSGDYTVTDSDGVSVLLVDASSGSVTITLPTAADNTGRVLHIKKIDVSGNTVTTDGEGSETIDDATTKVITAQYSDMRIVCDGTEWWIL
jgi:hypothetical protein